MLNTVGMGLAQKALECKKKISLARDQVLCKTRAINRPSYMLKHSELEKPKTVKCKMDLNCPPPYQSREYSYQLWYVIIKLL